MSLSGQRHKQLQEALIDAFPNIASLEQMLAYELEKNLRAIAGEGSLKDITFNLIKVADSQGWVEDLVRKAYKSNSGNLVLKAVAEEFLRECYKSVRLESPRKSTHMNPSYFDLEELIIDCLNIILNKKGLVGLAIPYNEDPFLKHFSDRLKNKLGKNFTTKEPFTLDYRSSVDTIVTKIKQYKNLLLSFNVICPIRLTVSQRKLSDEFWEKLSNADELKDTLKHSLIIVMVSRKITVFPKDVKIINPPKFTEGNVHNWICDVTDTQEWTAEDQAKWRKYVVDKCKQEKGEFLDVRLVYEHLEETSILFQEGYTTAEAFLKKLKQIIYSDVETLY